MDGIGKIDRRRAARQGHDRALGREDVDLVREQINFDVLEKLLRIAGLLLHFQNAAQPFARPLVGAFRRAVASLVQPVGGDTGFGDLVHFVGADLHFNRHAEGPEQHRVQGLVAVSLGDGDVVLELAGHRLVQAVQHTERAVAGVDAVHDDAEGVDVVHPREAQMLLAHFFVDAVDVFLAAQHMGNEALLTQMPLDAVLDLVHDLLAVAADAHHLRANGFIAQRIERREA